ncbi:uncharacterized protein LOC108743354 isoform X2 [Agrilus planipennis]|uniref:Uncharacterized protein LOC108743354 isoform X2 n=1 Tax=Agrilus planipennis TaxID=224129 RepID=A0A1W4XPJ3_AGRPL|nr:uncharacterized protein LOC108743354 isoform X2 [Agrilus planipennis]
MNGKQTFSQKESDQESKYDEENRGDLKPDKHCYDFEDFENISVASETDSQENREELHTNSQQNTIHLLTFTKDYKKNIGLQRQASTNLYNYFPLQSLINNNKLSSDSLQLKYQRDTVGNVESCAVIEEKRLLNKYNKMPKDLTFRQRLKVYVEPLVRWETTEDSFQPVDTRHAFMRSPIAQYFRDHRTLSIILISTMLGLYVILPFVPGCCVPWLPTKYPANIMLLVLYMFLGIIGFGVLAAFYPYIVITAAGLLLAMVAFVRVCSIPTGCDISSNLFMFIAAVCTLLLAVTACLIVYIVTGLLLLYIIYCGIGIAVWIAAMVHVLRIVMSDPMCLVCPEDEVPAAIYIYTCFGGMCGCRND